jgi:AcrR family transcriptional regulator
VQKCAVIVVRYASGGVEYWYEAAVPQVGDRVGRDGSGFVTSVELEGADRATVLVGTLAPEFVNWEDLAPATAGGRRSGRARERILAAAYELFSRRGIRAVGTDEIVERAGVARSTLYRHFRTKEDLVLAFLQRREQRWTREFVEAEARRRGSTPREQLLAIFDVFDEWFHRDDFEGCSFINTLLEVGDREGPLGGASVAHLEYIRSVVARIAEDAGVEHPEAFAESWHILMKGSIVAAGEGDLLAARRARAMGESLLDEHVPVAPDDAPSEDPIAGGAAAT